MADENSKKTGKNAGKEEKEEKEEAKLPPAPTINAAEIPIDLEVEKSSFINKKVVAVLIILLLMAGAAVGGFFFFKSSKGASEKKVKQETEKVAETKKEEKPEASPSAQPTKEEINLSEYSIQILNGSGVSGEAGAVNDLLKKQGFKDSDTGNADSYDYTDTEVALKENVPEAVFEAIKSALSNYNVIKSDPLDKDSSYDAVVTVGAKSE